MKSVKQAVKIKALKIKATGLYASYHNLLNEYDCGNNLAEFINPDIKEVRSKFNDIMNQLKKLDPDCPDFNL